LRLLENALVNVVMNFLLPVLAAAAVTTIAGILWWLMACRPSQWAAYVDHENNFWREKGLISATLAERLKRWEKGAVLKWLAALTTIVATIGLAITLTVLIRVELLEHHRLRMPYNPVLHRAPAHPKPKH
jgi:hypothetical protein